ncbi:MAG: DUF6569 family protein [Nanoarchaeota archaeon]
MKAAELFDGLSLGRVHSHKNLAFRRLYGPNRFQHPVLTLDEALGTGKFRVTDSGDAPTVIAQSDLEQDVFIGVGMIFVGDSQNRAAIHPLIVPAHSQEVSIPVNCVQHSRYTRRGSAYSQSSSISMASIRSGIVAQEHTWSTIADAASSLGLETDDHAQFAEEADLGDYLAAFGPPKPKQIGFITAVRQNGNCSFYSDMVGNEELYGKLHNRLAASVALVAKQKNPGAIEIRKDQFIGFLREVLEAKLIRQDLDGSSLADIYILQHPEIAGSALLYKGIPVQVSLRKDKVPSGQH